jgi:hypothetical protein
MKRTKPNENKVNMPFAIYLSSFNTQSFAVREATRAWAADKLVSKKHSPRPR